MSILRHGTDIRGPAVRPVPGDITAHRLPPVRSAPAAARALASVLVLGAALFYLAVAVKGVGGLLLGPPPEMVTTAGDLASSARSGHVSAQSAGGGGHLAGPGGNDGLEVLLRPLAITGAALAGLLLLWCGGRGLRSRHDQRRWRNRQVTGLIGFGVGTAAFALGLAVTAGTAAAYTDSVWNGLEPIRPSAVLALLVGTIALLVPAPGPGPRRRRQGHSSAGHSVGNAGNAGTAAARRRTVTAR